MKKMAMASMTLHIRRMAVSERNGGEEKYRRRVVKISGEEHSVAAEPDGHGIKKRNNII